MKRLLPIVLLLALLTALTGCGSAEDRIQYQNAKALYEEGKFASALKSFEEIVDYKDSEDYVKACRYYTALLTVSPDSTVEDGYSGNVSCTADNAQQFAQAVETLKSLDGYKNSERILKAAQKALDAYNTETRIQREVTTIENQLVGYVDHCEYNGSDFNVYFADGYPVTFDVVMRGQTEAVVAKSWTTVRSWFTDFIFDYFPDCTVNLIDRDGNTIGSYLYAADIDDVTVLFDIATKPF